MHVQKRDGRKEAVHFDKITARITKLAYGLSPEFCDPVRGRERERKRSFSSSFFSKLQCLRRRRRFFFFFSSFRLVFLLDGVPKAAPKHSKRYEDDALLSLSGKKEEIRTSKVPHSALEKSTHSTPAPSPPWQSTIDETLSLSL